MVICELATRISKLKVEYHRHVFEKIWSSMVDFINLIRHLSPSCDRMAQPIVSIGSLTELRSL